MPRRRRKILLTIATIFLVAIAYRVFAVYEIRKGECPAIPPTAPATSAPKGTRLLVMAYNIQGHAAFVKPKHIEEIAETIRRLNPDIVAINEAHRHTWQARFRDHVADLQRLTGMRGVYGKSYDFLGGEFGNLILTKGQIVSADVHRLPTVGEPRTLLDAKIRFGDATIDMFVTHVAAWRDMQQTMRGRQLSCAAAHIRNARYPAIVAGDLNAPPDSPEVIQFARSSGTKACGAPLGPTHKIMNQEIDFIFASPGWSLRNARVVDEGPSDHRPVLAELEWKGQ